MGDERPCLLGMIDSCFREDLNHQDVFFPIMTFAGLNDTLLPTPKSSEAARIKETIDTLDGETVDNLFSREEEVRK